MLPLHCATPSFLPLISRFFVLLPYICALRRFLFSFCQLYYSSESLPLPLHAPVPLSYYSKYTTIIILLLRVRTTRTTVVFHPVPLSSLICFRLVIFVLFYCCCGVLAAFILYVSAIIIVDSSAPYLATTKLAIILVSFKTNPSTTSSSVVTLQIGSRLTKEYSWTLLCDASDTLILSIVYSIVAIYYGWPPLAV